MDEDLRWLINELARQKDIASQQRDRACKKDNWDRVIYNEGAYGIIIRVLKNFRAHLAKEIREDE